MPEQNHDANLNNHLMSLGKTQYFTDQPNDESAMAEVLSQCIITQEQARQIYDLGIENATPSNDDRVDFISLWKKFALRKLPIDTNNKKWLEEVLIESGNPKEKVYSASLGAQKYPYSVIVKIIEHFAHQKECDKRLIDIKDRRILSLEEQFDDSLLFAEWISQNYWKYMGNSKEWINTLSNREPITTVELRQLFVKSLYHE